MTAAVPRISRICKHCGDEFFARQKTIDAGGAKYCSSSCRAKSVNLTHGCAAFGKHSPEYASWHGMIQRCCNENDTAYANYGGRGISVCKEWRESFKSFLKDMGLVPKKGMTLDRINVNGNYEPGNCRWANKKTQQLNRRVTIRLDFNGTVATICEWSKLTGITEKAIRNRYENKWPVEKILTQPMHAKPSLRKANI